MNTETIQNYFFVSLLGLILILTFFMFLPFLSAIILSITLAIIFNPLYEKVLIASRGQRSVASLLTIFIILTIFLVPITLFGIKVFNQAESLYVQITTPGAEDSTLTQISSSVEKRINQLFPGASFSVNFHETTQLFFGWLVKNIGPIFSSLARAFTLFLLSLLTLYYIFKDGPRFKRGLFNLSPLSDNHNETIFTKIKLAVNSVIRGYLIIATIQGILAGIGFTIFGVPNAALWGLVTIVSALVPIFGTSLVTLPAVVYLYFTGHGAASLGLFIWALAAVSLIDNFLGPKLIGRGVKIHSLLILLSVLGGLALFGPIGFLVGPITLALLFALLEIYPTLILEKNKTP